MPSKRRDGRPSGPADSARPFPRALHDLLEDRDEFTTSSGNVVWSRFADALGIHPETLRKYVAGERDVENERGVALMEDIARVLQIRPAYFVEYRLHQRRQELDPRVVGFDRALENLRARHDDETRLA